MPQQITDIFTIIIKGKPNNYTIEASGPKKIRVDPQPFELHVSNLPTTSVELTDKHIQISSKSIKELGQALYRSLFLPQIATAYGRAQQSAKRGSSLRLGLYIEPPELATLPWEAMHDGQDWLATRTDSPLVRILPQLPDEKSPLQKLQIRGALRILFVGASPEGLPGLKIGETAAQLQKLLQESIDKKRIVFDVVLNATLDDLRQNLRQEYHILYFAGHGAPNGIYFDDGQGDVDSNTDNRLVGDPDLVSAETLARELEGKAIRLVFLSACNTGRTDQDSGLLAGFAQQLAKLALLPGIISMQSPISDMQAGQLAAHFFDAVAKFQPVDVALAEARKTLIRQEQFGRDAIAPVMYLQAKDSALFQRARNWIAIGAIAFAVLVLTVLIAQTLFFQPDRRDIAAAQQTAQAEVTQRAIAQATGYAEATQRVMAEATAVAESTQRAIAQGTAIAEATQRAMAEGTAMAEAEMRAQIFEKSNLIPVGNLPTKLLFDGKALWVVNAHDKNIEAISPIDGRRLGLVSFEGGPQDIVFDGRYIWAAQGDFLHAVDPDTYTIVKSIPNIYFGTYVLVFDGTRIWIGHHSASVQSFYPATGAFGKQIALESSPTDIIVTKDILWVSTVYGPVQNIDTTTNSIMKTVEVGTNPYALTSDGENIWVANSDDDTVQSIDMDTYTTGEPISVGNYPFSITFDGSRVWVANKEDDTINVVDPNTNGVIRTLVVGETPVDMGFDGNRVWVVNRGDNTIQTFNLTVDVVGRPMGVDGDPVSLAFDGKNIWVAAKNNNVVQAIDPQAQNIIKTVNIIDIPTSLAFDGEKLWVSTENDNVQSIDPKTGNKDNLIPVQSGPSDLVFDGNSLWVANSKSNSIQSVDISSGEILNTFNVGINPTDLAFDGNYIWVANRGDSSVQVIDPSDGNIIKTISVAQAPIELLYDGEQIWVASNQAGSILTLIDVRTLEVIEEIDIDAFEEFILDGYIEQFGLIGIGYDGQRIWVSDSFKNMIAGIDRRTRKPFGPYIVGQVPREVLFDGQQLWVANEYDQAVQPMFVGLLDEPKDLSQQLVDNIVSNPTPKPVAKSIASLDTNLVSVNNVTFSPNGEVLAVGGDNTVQLWDTDTGELVRNLEGHFEMVLNISFSPDGRNLASSGSDSVRMWRISNGEQLYDLSYSGNQNTSMIDIAFSPNGKLLASTKTDELLLYDLDTKSDLYNRSILYALGEEPFFSTAFSPNGNIVASGAVRNGTIKLWRVSDGTLQHNLEGHTTAVSSVAFSPDGAVLASASLDGSLRLWQVSDGTLLRTLEENIYEITSVAFSPSGSTLAAGVGDGTIQLWNIYDGTMLHSFQAHTTRVTSVDFSPDGNLLASGGGDGVARLWNAQ